MADGATPRQPDARTGERLGRLPGVDALLAGLGAAIARHGRRAVVDAVRADLDALRAALRAGAGPGDDAALDAHVAAGAVAARIDAALAARARLACARALNATGVVLHTGLGRAPLPAEARAAVAAAAGFAVVEVEPESGRRGQRDGPVAALLAQVAGAEAATVVNNNAGATLIALAALAAGRPVVVSRGQLVEIGGSYRIPDVMEQSGCRLVEVGTTNRTHLGDYARALDAHPDAALLLRVHTSNFRVVGFTHEVPLEELVALGRARGVPVMDDLGSGSFVDLGPLGLPHEPLVQRSLAAGAGLVTFSGDKLLGGPQAGLIAGQAALVERVRRHPLYRALRPGKLTLAALEATLALYRDPERALARVPALRMIAADAASLEARAQGLARAIERGLAADGRPEALAVDVAPGRSKVGGGSYAVEELPTWVVAVRPAAGGGAALEALARALRTGEPAVFGRLADGRLLLDPRTLDGPEEDAAVARAVVAAARRADRAEPGGLGSCAPIADDERGDDEG